MKAEYLVKDVKYCIMKFSQSLENILLPILLFFAPIQGILITVAAFIILDTISGIWKSRVKKVPITSRGMSGIISKMLLYQAAILATYLLDFYVVGDILEGVFGIKGLTVKAAALLLVFIEAQSINENYKIAKGIDLWEEFKKLLSRAKEVTSTVNSISKDVEKLEDSTDIFSDKDFENEP